MTQTAKDAAAGILAAQAGHARAAVEAEAESRRLMEAMNAGQLRMREQNAAAKRCIGEARDLVRALANADDITPPDAIETDRYGTRVARVTFARAVLHTDARDRRGPRRWVAYGHTSYSADIGSADSRPTFSWDPGRGTSDPDKLEAQRVEAEATARAWLAAHTAAAWLAARGIEPSPAADIVAVIDAPSFDHYQGRADVVAGWRVVLAGPDPLPLDDGKVHSWSPFRDVADPSQRDPWRSEPGAFGPMGHGPDDRIPEAVRAFMDRHRADVLSWFVGTLRRSAD